MAVTFVAPHSLNARPLVVPRGSELIVWNRTADVAATALVDGHASASWPPAGAPSRRRRRPARRCSRRSPRSRSSAVTAEPSLRSAPQPAIENLVLIREAELELAAGLSRSRARRERGRRSSRRRSGCCSARRAMPRAIGAAGAEAYVEAELDVPEGFFDDEELAALAELAPEDEDGLVLARRVFADGRTRAYAWGRGGRARGSRGRRRAADRDVGPVRAAPPRPAGVPARGARRVLRRRAAAAPARGAARLARAARGPAAARGARTRRRAPSRRGSRELRGARRGDGGARAGGRGRAAGRARAAPPRHGARRGGGGRRRGARARRGRGRGRARRVGRARARAARAAGAGARARGRGAARRRAAPARGRLATCARSSPRSRPSRTASSRSRASSSGSPMPSAASARLLRASCSRVRQRRARSSTRSPTGSIRPLPRRRRSPPPRRRRSALADGAPRRRAAQAAEPFAAAVAEELRGVGMGEGEFRVELREREPGATGADEADLPDPAERRPPVRAGRRDGVGRRALARRARDRGGRRRRDPRLRRDRRRHRRRDGARGGGDAAAARRARTGDHDHAPAPDRERRRRALPRREGSRRPDAHADRPPRRRASGATSSSACSAAREFLLSAADERCSSSTPARRGSAGGRRSSSGGSIADDIAIIDHTDLDRVSAEELVESGVRVVVNVAALAVAAASRTPARSLLVRGGVRLIDVDERRPLRAGLGRRAADGARRQPLPERHLPRVRPRARRARARRRARRAAEPRDRGARGVRRQHDALPARGGAAARGGHRLAAAARRASATGTRSSSRAGRATSATCAWCGRTCATSSPCSSPSTAAPTRCVEEGWKPDVIVGDMDSVTRRDAPLRRRDPRPRLPRGATRRARSALRRLGIPFSTVAAPGISRGHRAPARPREGRDADRRRRDAPQPRRVPRARPGRDVVHLRDAAEGGGDPRRREGRLAARQPPARHLAARSASPAPASRRPSWPSPPRRRSAASSRAPRSAYCPEHD